VFGLAELCATLNLPEFHAAGMVEVAAHWGQWW